MGNVLIGAAFGVVPYVSSLCCCGKKAGGSNGKSEQKEQIPPPANSGNSAPAQQRGQSRGRSHSPWKADPNVVEQLTSRRLKNVVYNSNGIWFDTRSRTPERDLSQRRRGRTPGLSASRGSPLPRLLSPLPERN